MRSDKVYDKPSNGRHYKFTKMFRPFLCLTLNLNQTSRTQGHKNKKILQFDQYTSNTHSPAMSKPNGEGKLLSTKITRN